jgi:uncharacterized membrane protein
VPTGAPTGAPALRRQLGLVARGLSHRAADAEPLEFADFATLGSYPPVLYGPQALGLRLGRLIGLPPLGQFYAGRIGGGLAAVAMTLMAVAMLPFGARSVLILACLPGVASQMASYSADAMIFGLSFLSLAVVLRSERIFTTRAQWGLVLLLPLLTLAKGVYLPIAAAGLGSTQGRTLRRSGWIFAGSATGIALFIVWFGVLAGDAINRQAFVSSVTLRHAVSASPGAQLHFMLLHPVFAIAAIGKTMLVRLPAYAAGIIGRFGWLNVWLPAPLYALAVTALFGAVIVTDANAPMPARSQRALWLGLAALMFLLVHCALYLTASELGEGFVEGVQGRYFVPLLPLVALAVLWRARPGINRLVDAVLPAIVLVLMLGGLATAAISFWRLA